MSSIHSKSSSKEIDWSKVEEDLEKVAVSLSNWTSPGLKEDSSFSSFRLVTEFQKELQDRIAEYSKGQILLKNEPTDEQWELGIKEPGVRLALLSKDRKKMQRIWVPPISRSIFVSQVMDPATTYSLRLRSHSGLSS